MTTFHFRGASLGLLIGLGAVAFAAAGAGPSASGAPAGKLPEVVPANIEAVMSAVRRPGAKAVLVNVWATWCEPCVEEMPDILKFYKESRDHGLRLILVSADLSSEKKAVARFLASLGVDFRSYLKTGNDQTFIDGLDPRWNGTLPASLLFDGSGQRKRLWSGPVTHEALKKELGGLLTGHPEAKTTDPTLGQNQHGQNQGQPKRRTP